MRRPERLRKLIIGVGSACWFSDYFDLTSLIELDNLLDFEIILIKAGG